MQAIATEITEAINKHLPQALGDALQQRLKKGDEDAAALLLANRQLETSRADSRSAQARYERAEATLAKHAVLDARDEAVTKREASADLRDAKVALAAANENAKFARDVALGLVRNVEWRNQVFETHDQRAIPVPPSGSVQHAFQQERSSTSTIQQGA